MPRILHRLPVPISSTNIVVRDEEVRIRAYEIVVWVSLAAREVFDPSRLPRFPALLDTAHTHHFSIQEDHLLRWAGVRPEELGLGRGFVHQQDRRLALRSACLWIYSNQPGQWKEIADQPPHRLGTPEGILVYPRQANFPRLPLLGLRTIMQNRLRLVVDGDRGLVSLRTRRWWWPFG